MEYLVRNQHGTPTCPYDELTISNSQNKSYIIFHSDVYSIFIRSVFGSYFSLCSYVNEIKTFIDYNDYEYCCCWWFFSSFRVVFQREKSINVPRFSWRDQLCWGETQRVSQNKSCASGRVLYDRWVRNFRRTNQRKTRCFFFFSLRTIDSRFWASNGSSRTIGNREFISSAVRNSKSTAFETKRYKNHVTVPARIYTFVLNTFQFYRKNKWIFIRMSNRRWFAINHNLRSRYSVWYFENQWYESSRNDVLFIYMILDKRFMFPIGFGNMRMFQIEKLQLFGENDHKKIIFRIPNIFSSFQTFGDVPLRRWNDEKCPHGFGFLKIIVKGCVLSVLISKAGTNLFTSLGTVLGKRYWANDNDISRAKTLCQAWQVLARPESVVYSYTSSSSMLNWMFTPENSNHPVVFQ